MNTKTIELSHIRIETLDNPYFENTWKLLENDFDNEDYEGRIFHVLGRDIELPITDNTILFQTEQLHDSNTHLNMRNYLRRISRYHKVFDYDKLNIHYCKRIKGITTEIEYHPYHYLKSYDQISSDNTTKDIDILFYGFMNARRSLILSDLQNKFYSKFNIQISLNKLDNLEFIKRAKIILNLHNFSPYNRCESERISYLLSNRTCIISEISDYNPFGDMIVESNLKDLPFMIKNYLDSGAYVVQADESYTKFKEL